MSNEMDDRLGRAIADRLATRPEFLAWVFAEVGRQGLSEARLVARLSIPATRFLELSLCPKPRPDHFAEDVDNLAREFGLDGVALSSIVRQADIIASIGNTTQQAGWLMAAREKDEGDVDEVSGV